MLSGSRAVGVILITVCVFELAQSLHRHLQAYGGDELLLVADPGSKYGENFYFVLNDALKASELKVRDNGRMLSQAAAAACLSVAVTTAAYIARAPC